MTTTNAIATLRQHMADATDDQIRDIQDCSSMGGGAVYDENRSVLLRQIILNQLEDAIALNLSERNGEFTPCHAGDWHNVLATLAVEGDRATIHDIAKDLREHHLSETTSTT